MPSHLSREELKKKRDKYIIPSVKQLYADAPNFVRGEKQFLYDEKGKEYLDMFAGIVTVSVGHCHPKVVERTVEQVKTLQHTSTSFMTEPMVELAEKLADITPGNLSKSFKSIWPFGKTFTYSSSIFFCLCRFSTVCNVA